MNQEFKPCRNCGNTNIKIARIGVAPSTPVFWADCGCHPRYAVQGSTPELAKRNWNAVNVPFITFVGGETAPQMNRPVEVRIKNDQYIFNDPTLFNWGHAQTDGSVIWRYTDDDL